VVTRENKKVQVINASTICECCGAVRCGALVWVQRALSAVDPRVERILFDKCIGHQGMLAGASLVFICFFFSFPSMPCFK
jgi:hypothetical protein